MVGGEAVGWADLGGPVTNIGRVNIQTVGTWQAWEGKERQGGKGKAGVERNCREEGKAGGEGKSPSFLSCLCPQTCSCAGSQPCSSCRGPCGPALGGGVPEGQLRGARPHPKRQRRCRCHHQSPACRPEAPGGVVDHHHLGAGFTNRAALTARLGMQRIIEEEKGCTSVLWGRYGRMIWFGNTRRIHEEDSKI